MIISKKEQIEINKYFKNFTIQHKKVISIEDNALSIITEIENKNDIAFQNNWNYIMVLVLIIERHYGIKKIITYENYVGFEFENFSIQDKGCSKIEAYNLVCFKTLQKLWKEGKTSITYENTEPFDEIDLK